MMSDMNIWSAAMLAHQTHLGYKEPQGDDLFGSPEILVLGGLTGSPGPKGFHGLLGPLEVTDPFCMLKHIYNSFFYKFLFKK